MCKIVYIVLMEINTSADKILYKNCNQNTFVIHFGFFCIRPSYIVEPLYCYNYMPKKSCPIFIVYLLYTKETFWTNSNCFQKLNIKYNTLSMVFMLDGT